jgi:Bifunctional DNA primase/polymerase, N-terminal
MPYNISAAECKPFAVADGCTAVATTVDHARSLGRQGAGVFPCKNIPTDPAQHKAPLTVRGFRDASTDEAVICAWWECWPNALVGVVAEQFCVIDVDLQHPEARSWLDQHRDRIPSTRIHRTQRGGLHFIFRPQAEVGCSVGSLASHVDTRGQGKGYVIWWPAHGFEVMHPEVIAPVPEWVVTALRPATPEPVPSGPAVKCPSDTFVTAKLAGIISRAAAAQEGERNAITFWCGCRLAEMVQEQMIGRDEAIALLVEASSRTGLPQREILRTARSAFRSVLA